MDYTQYPVETVEDIIRLRRRIKESKLPAKKTDRNLLVGTWNIRNFSRVRWIGE